MSILGWGDFEEICESLDAEQCSLLEEAFAIVEAERAVDIWIAAKPGRTAQRDIFEGQARSTVMAAPRSVKLWRYTLRDDADPGPQEITGATPAALREAVLKHLGGE